MNQRREYVKSECKECVCFEYEETGGGGGGEAYGIYRKSRLCTSCSVVSAVERVGVRRDVVLAKGAQK